MKMGWTNPTHRDYLHQVEDRYQPFRRTLRRQHQEDFDRLFDRACEHASAAGYQNSIDPEQLVLFSILLSQKRHLQQLEEQVATLRETTDTD